MSEIYPLLEGHFTIVAIHHDEPQRLVGVRHQTPLVVGVGDGECFLASNVAAFLSETRRAIFPATARSSPSRPKGHVSSSRGRGRCAGVEELDWDDEQAERGGYETFMLKEIYEQPEAVAETLGERIRHGASSSKASA